MQQLAMLKRNLRVVDPEQWKNAAIGAIKGTMRKMGIGEEDKKDCYLKISARLNMKRPFQSLKKFSKTDLGRVHGAVSRDFKKWKR